MKFALVGNGWLSIPPYGWGAVETLIWDTACALKKFGHEVYIINEKSPSFAWDKINEINPDIIHIHNPCALNAKEHIKYKTYFTCHPSYDDQESGILTSILNMPIETRPITIVLNSHVYEKYKAIGSIRLLPNAMNYEPFWYSSRCEYPNKSISVASITCLKRVPNLFPVSSIDFVGINIENLPITTPNYKGEWSRQMLYTELTKYANLVLISEREAHGIVIIEAMFAGLGIVCSENVFKNFNINAPWFTIIPENKIHDIPFIEIELERNRKIAIQHRNEIREYALKTFDIDRYIENLYM
jgi:glycosyltransferase involved in cell wall biosynthesis